MGNYQDVKNYRKRLKERMVYVMGDKCACCGYNKCIQALEFHHLDPKEKDLTFSKNTNCSWGTVVSELPKTILVCANCHREIHAGLIDNDSLKSSFIEQRAIEISQKVEEQKTKKTNYCQRCHKEISSNATFCSECYKLQKREERPDAEQLTQILIEYKGNFSAVGRLFNLTSSAIVKWCKEYNLPYHSEDYKPPKKEKLHNGLPKAVYMLDKTTNEILKEFESMQAAAHFLGNNGATHIGDVCRGKRKTAYGYKWKYKEV